jgi:spore maturation protein CgeB
MKFIVSIPGMAHTIPMNTYVPQALRALGHEVIVYNHERDNLAERIRQKISFSNFIAYKNKQLLQLIDTEKPNVFFSIYGRTQDHSTIEAIKARKVKTVSWWLNDPFELGFKLAPSAAYDFYFSNSLYTQDEYRKQGVKNIHFLPVGVDTATHKPAENTETPKKYKYEVLFAGDFHPIREKIITELVNNQIPITMMGPWSEKRMVNPALFKNLFITRRFFSPQEMVSAFQEAKIILNIHTWLVRYDYGINPRLFEASGTKSFQICDTKKEIPLLFEPQKEIILYDTVPQLIEQIKYYLQHDSEREKIAAAAYQRAMKDHTYLKRMEKVLEIIT